MDDRPQFDPKYLVGIEQVDKEHQRLFEIFCTVHASLGARGAATEALTRKAVADLLEYAATHFASEEGLMEAASYPGLAAHRELHRQLLSQARDMEMRVESGDRYLPAELSQFLYKWLINHIEIHDRQFGDFMAARVSD